jgi:hypothetical protein
MNPNTEITMKKYSTLVIFMMLMLSIAVLKHMSTKGGNQLALPPASGLINRN